MGAEGSQDDFRDFLQEIESRTAEAYDKTLVACSTGGLAVSFGFVAAMLDEPEVKCVLFLALAWLYWIISLTCVLGAQLSSSAAMRHAVDQLDEGRIHEERPGGMWDIVSIVLTLAGGVFFLGGVIAMSAFAIVNLTA